MGESIHILAVRVKDNEEKLLENIIIKLQGEINFKENSRDINADPQLDIYGKAVELKCHIEFNNKHFSIHMEKRTYTDENIVVDLTIATDLDSTSLQDDIYILKVKIKNVLNSLFKGVYWQKDSQNEKICSELYSSIHILENRFRELIVQFMVNKYGFDWTRRITDDLQKKIEGFSGWYRRKYEDFKSVKTELFNLQIDDLMTLLKSAYDKQPVSKEELINSITSEEANSEIITKLIEEYKVSTQEKDIWDKYFVELLGEEFPDHWEFLKHSRNMVAHNKPICNQLNLDTRVIIDKINAIFDGVEVKYNEMFKTYEEIEVERLWLEYEYGMELEEEARYAEIYFTDAGLDPTPSEEAVIEEITESDEYQNIISISDEYISGYIGIIDEIKEIIEEGDNKVENSEPNEQSILILKLAKLIFEDIMDSKIPWEEDIQSIEDEEQLNDFWFDVKSAFEDHFDKLSSRLENSSYSEEFGTNAKLVTLIGTNSTLEITSNGDFFPSRGSQDEIRISLNVDNNTEGVGWVTRSYGDYIIEDTGAAIAVNEDALYIRIDEVIKELIAFTDANFEKLLNIRDEVYEVLDLE